MGQTLTTWYVERLYGKGCPIYGKKVYKADDFSEEKLKMLNFKQKKAVAKTLGIQIQKKKSSKMSDEDLKLSDNEFAKAAVAAVTKGDSFSHGLWDEILKACVSRGTLNGVETNVFDYKKLIDNKGKDDQKADHKSMTLGQKLDQYIESLSKPDFETLTRNHQMALLINGYNALTVGLLVRAMREGKTLKSIRDLNTKELKVWDIPAGTFCGKGTTLTEMEHKFLRLEWGEPRLHACIVCASVSCPDLRGEAFYGDERLDAQMTEQMEQWMLNKKKGFNIKENGHVQLSSIFLWFKGDFKPRPLQFIWDFLNESEQKKLGHKKKKHRVEFLEYDWNINEKK
mmetsp:Transcript_21752/g.32373  ORF Transcript_21752/g.32373 Transcript_21752/m.32373 type:complete len:341 (+) Transcript_21752:71-1093(+)